MAGETAPADWTERLAVDPEIKGGKPVIKGRHVLVQVIVDSLAGGDTIEQVCDGYKITEDDVKAALAYAAEPS